jgi:hypothetical protein
MVSNRCKIIVKAELKKLGLHCTAIQLGEAEIKEDIPEQKRNKLNAALQKTGLELLEDSKSILVEKLRNEIVEMIYRSEELPRINVSDYLSKKLDYSYTHLARLFSERRRTTLKHYFIVTEIAFKLHYSSTAHLCNQLRRSPD